MLNTNNPFLLFALVSALDVERNIAVKKKKKSCLFSFVKCRNKALIKGAFQLSLCNRKLWALWFRSLVSGRRLRFHHNSIKQLHLFVFVKDFFIVFHTQVYMLNLFILIQQMKKILNSL